MDARNVIELPIELGSKAHEALMNVWWTAIVLKKVSGKLFQQFLSSDAQFNILVLLKDSKEPLTQNDLSRKLLVDKSNITGLIDRLEKQELIKRLPVEGDRRSYHIRLTEHGEKLIEQLDAAYTEKVHDIMSTLTSEEYDELIRLTKKVRQGILINE